MYHMLPYSYRPEVRSTRRNHPQFLTDVQALADNLIRETEVVDTQHPVGRKLFNAMDTFFAYGLLTADRAYWRCIKQYMPRAEQEMLIAECGNPNDRYLSIAWLKTAFNKGTLHFQLLSLNNPANNRFLVRFYHENSAIRNESLLISITELIGRLQHVQFAYYSTRQMRPAPLPAVVIDRSRVMISSRAAARQRKITETEASSDTVLNEVPTDIPQVFASSIDQDVLLEELVRQRRSRMVTEKMNALKLLENDVFIDEREEEPVVQEKLEDVMVKTMSEAKMDLIDQRMEDVLAQVEPEEEIPVFKLSDGECQLPQGDILHLAIHVFEISSEKVIEAFVIYENFHSDSKILKYLVLTNYNVYVLKYQPDAQQSASDGALLPISGTLKPVLRLPHDRIQTIKIGMDNLTFMLISNDTGFIHYSDNEIEIDDGSKTTYWAFVGALSAGAHLINSVINVVEHTSRNVRPHPDIDDHISYMGLLQAGLESQLKKAIDIRASTLCYWYEHPIDLQKNPDSISGYLYKKNINVANWLLKNNSEPEQRFCMISGTKMYVFIDSTCKEGEQVIDLSECEYTSIGRKTFMLKSSHGNFEFESTNQDKFSEWGTTISHIIEQAGSELFLTSCMMTITDVGVAIVQEGEKFWQDGFLRLLNDLNKDIVRDIVLVFPSDKTDENNLFTDHNSVFCIITNTGSIHYFFVRFAAELERLGNALSVVSNKSWKTLDKELIKTPIGKAIHNTCCSVKNLWPSGDLLNN